MIFLADNDKMDSQLIFNPIILINILDVEVYIMEIPQRVKGAVKTLPHPEQPLLHSLTLLENANELPKLFFQPPAEVKQLQHSGPQVTQHN